MPKAILARFMATSAQMEAPAWPLDRPRSPISSKASGRSRFRAGNMSSAWNPADIERMKLPPCHALFQFYVADGRLSCQLLSEERRPVPRVPFNIASLCPARIDGGAGYGKLQPGEFVHHAGGRTSTSTISIRRASSLRAPPRPFPLNRGTTRSAGHLRLQIRRFHPGRLRPHPAIKAPIAV